jgi:hypothetical protein
VISRIGRYDRERSRTMHLALLVERFPANAKFRSSLDATRMRDEGQVLIGGFHSVMEWECLGILLRGRQPVIWVPARSIVGMHLKPELVPAFNAGRLLILSPFPTKDKRITAALAEACNRFVGALADRVFVPHASPNSKTQDLCDELRAAGKEIQSISSTPHQEK